ncbi:MAG: hypothetical protein ACREQ5_22800 [Candidatus Dormibacteria bacterium]
MWDLLPVFVSAAVLALTLGPHSGDTPAAGVALLCTTVLAVPIALIVLGVRAARDGTGRRAALITALGLCGFAIALNRGPQTGRGFIAGAVILCITALAVPVALSLLGLSRSRARA